MHVHFCGASALRGCFRLFREGFRSFQALDVGYMDRNEYGYCPENSWIRRPVLQVAGMYAYITDSTVIWTETNMAIV